MNNKMLKLAIIGSRDFDNYDLLCETLKSYAKFEIISGGAAGADSLAKRYAMENVITITEYLPDYTLGRAATHIRNDKIIKECDEVLAFWDGKSRGTASVIKKVKAKKKPLTVIHYGEEQN